MLSIIFIGLVLGQNVRAEEVCDTHGQMAKFECAKVGDEFAGIGDFKNAKKAWKISCEKGLTSSCQSVTEMDADLAKFKRKWASDPGSKAFEEQAKRKSTVLKCTVGDLDSVKCLSEGRRLAKSGNTEASVEILSSLCGADNSDACFELGGIYLRAKKNEDSVQPYMTACSLGHASACTILQQVQTNLKMKQDEDNRAEDLRRLAAEKEEARKKEISKAFDYPKRTSCTTTANGFGGFKTDCEEP